jgi:hypothetical protein
MSFSKAILLTKNVNKVFTCAAHMLKSKIIYDLSGKTPLVFIINSPALGLDLERTRRLSIEAFTVLCNKYSDYLYTHFSDKASMFELGSYCDGDMFYISLNPEYGKDEDYILNYVDCLKVLKPTPVLQANPQVHSNLDYEFIIKDEYDEVRHWDEYANFSKRYNIYKPSESSNYFIEAEYFFTPREPSTKFGIKHFEEFGSESSHLRLEIPDY